MKRVKPTGSVSPEAIAKRSKPRSAVRRRGTLRLPRNASSDGRSLLADIIAPLELDRFLSKYFQRAPLIVRGDQAKFNHLFTAADLKVGLDRVTEIRAIFAGLRQAQIHPADIKDMICAGATVCISGLEYAHPKLQGAIDLIRKELNYAGRISFRAYLSPPGSGFDLHFDARVATTLQITGEKQWWFSESPAEAFPVNNSPRDLAALHQRYPLPNLKRMRSAVLRPGDLLCLPAGTWHRARAKSTSLAINLAFDHGGASAFDLIVSALKAKFRLQERWRAPLPVAPDWFGNGIPTAIGQIMRDSIDEMLGALLSLRESDVELQTAWLSAIAGESDFPALAPSLFDPKAETVSR